VCTFPAVARSTQPSTLHGTVNEYLYSSFEGQFRAKTQIFPTPVFNSPVAGVTVRIL